jgi:ketosteroid isomerase-like protein
MKLITWIFIIIVISSCHCHKCENNAISKDEMIQIVKICDNNFNIGVQKKDSTFLADIYSDSAQYVQPNRPIIKGKSEIEKDWGGFIRMKENPIDLVLTINEVRGNREIIYETGHGYTLLADSAKWNFNYVNVWRLQKNGSYKLEVDTYTPMDK